MVKKTSEGLVKYAIKQIGMSVWYDTFGQLASESLYNEMISKYSGRYYNPFFDYRFHYGLKVHYGIGLIKGYMWSENADDPNPKYCSNGCPNIDIKTMYNSAKLKGRMPFLMPDVPGICVLNYYSDRIGVYVGNGYVIEARGPRGVKIEELNDSYWTHWCYCPYIEYNINKLNEKEKEKVELLWKISQQRD